MNKKFLKHFSKKIDKISRTNIVCYQISIRNKKSDIFMMNEAGIAVLKAIYSENSVFNI